MDETKPSLFGLAQSNRDFSLQSSWGKNEFNNSFPAALACYMNSKGIAPVYLTLDEGLKVIHGKIEVKDVFGLDPLAKDTFYAFESIFTQYQTLVLEGLPRVDLVVCKTVDGLTTECVRDLEIKLTALPDNTTANSDEENYGSEIVVRPDTIVYLALSIATSYFSKRNELLNLIEPFAHKVEDWRSATVMYPLIMEACDTLDQVILGVNKQQKPLLLEPIWKTRGKSLTLHDNCLDMFVWSDLAFTRLFIDCARAARSEVISRHSRSVLWLLKMLYDFAQNGQFNHRLTIDELTYDTRNDKAFAVSGAITRKYMKSPETLSPRIHKEEIRNIILGGGEKLLSPERRFDAALLSTPGLFKLD